MIRAVTVLRELESDYNSGFQLTGYRPEPLKYVLYKRFPSFSFTPPHMSNDSKGNTAKISIIK